MIFGYTLNNLNNGKITAKRMKTRITYTILHMIIIHIRLYMIIINMRLRYSFIMINYRKFRTDLLIVVVRETHEAKNTDTFVSNKYDSRADKIDKQNSQSRKDNSWLP